MLPLRYLYQTSPEASGLVLLGSAVRGLGKGWQVGVLHTDNSSNLFERLRTQLTDPTQLSISKDVRTLDQCQLLLSENPTDQQVAQLFNSTPHVMVAGEQINPDHFDLVSRFDEHKLNPDGVIAFVGNGKGKTTSAVGVAVKSLLEPEQQRPVSIIQWFKERKKPGALTWAINEHEFPALLKKKESLQFFPTGLGFFGSPNLDRVKGDQAYQQHRDKAYEGLELAKQQLQSNQYAAIILDEFVDTVQEIAGNLEYPLIDLHDVVDFFEYATQFPDTLLVITGRRVTPQYQKFVHQMITVHEVRHPFKEKGQGAISGLDF
ncbi:MAG: cob(I)yrinic acid a,c-diamide adenosyltransferase [Patescibacteria group bacterium]